jgi:hypothetical protein
MDGTGLQLDCQLAGVPAMSDRRVQLVHQLKYWNGSEKLRWQQPCSISGAVAQFFHQRLSGPAEELVVFVPPFPKGVAQFPHPLGDCARFFPSDQQSH